VATSAASSGRQELDQRHCATGQLAPSQQQRSESPKRDRARAHDRDGEPDGGHRRPASRHAVALLALNTEPYGVFALYLVAIIVAVVLIVRKRPANS
jgi:hypothetical protein